MDTGGTVERRARFQPDLGSPAAARAFVRSELEEEHVPDPPLETAILLTSELVSNALLHARTEVDLRLVMAASGVRVEVHDSGVRQPPASPAPAPLEATTGRGLMMVDALAQSWGVDGTVDGKTIWFELPVAR
jgi:anti-sigma regulatory factor (Ser/Thr protein kinase)